MKRALFDYLLILLGAFCLALGISLFLVPLQLSAGGISGIATILFYSFRVPLSVSNLFLNLSIFAFYIFSCGTNGLLKTVVGTVSLSAFLEILSEQRVPDFDFLSSLLVGGALVGLGVGLVIRAGGSSGGGDLLALSIKRYFEHIPISSIILFLDFIVILLLGAYFKSFSISVYSFLCMLISSRVADAVINLGVSARSIYITSQKSEEIKKMILTKFERGVTEFHTQGGFSLKEGVTLFCVVTPKEVPLLTKEIKKIDEGAFIVVSEVKEVLGKGF